MTSQNADLNSIDIVLVSDAKNPQTKKLTELAIESAGAGQKIIVVESNKAVFYESAITIHPDIPFNYNAYLNIGARVSTGDYIFFGNNDIIFIGAWKEKLISEMKNHQVVSASPFSPKLDSKDMSSYETGVIFGYDLVSVFCGWAFVWTRDFYNKVGGLNEDFTFWCSDNVTVQQLQNHDQRHMLVTSSLVYHFGRSTLVFLDEKQRHDYTISEITKFNQKYDTNLWKSRHIRGF